MNKAEFANIVELDEAAHNEPPLVNLYCLPSSLGILNMDETFVEILQTKILLSFFLCLKGLIP